MLLPILIDQIRDRSAHLARSAEPAAPVRAHTARPAARRRSPGAVRRTAAAALRRSADRLAPVTE